jgi:hypothetical protein
MSNYNKTLEITQQSIMVLMVAADMDQDKNLANCLVKCIGMGGFISKESETMLILNSGNLTVGLHYDGKEWSMHS